MPFTTVPDRLLGGEAVPRTEIIGYATEETAMGVTMCLEFMVMALVMNKVIVDDVLCFQITDFGQAMRIDFVKRIEGDCPECPDCP